MDKKYYINVNKQNVGPLSYDDIKAKIKQGELSEESYVFIPGNKDWLHIKDLDEFKNLIQEVPVEEKKIWFVHKNRQNLGPFSKNDIIDLMFNGDFDTKDFAWKEGLSEWKPIEEIEEFETHEHPSASIVRIDEKEIEEPVISQEPVIESESNIEPVIEQVQEVEEEQKEEEPEQYSCDSTVATATFKRSRKLIPELLLGLMLIISGIIEHSRSEIIGTFTLLAGLLSIIAFVLINRKKEKKIKQHG